MKFLFLTHLLTCFVQLPMNAQTSFGIKGGVNGSWMGIQNEKVKFGFHAGAFGCLDLSPNTLLQAELMYSQKGSDLNNVLLYDIPLSYTYHYLSLPVMIGFRLGDNVFLQMGPEISYLMNLKIVFGENAIKDNGAFPDFDLGALVGLQIEITHLIALQLRYVHGFTNSPTLNLTDINGNTIGVIEDGKNRVIQVGVSYKLSNDSQVTE